MSHTYYGIQCAFQLGVIIMYFYQVHRMGSRDNQCTQKFAIFVFVLLFVLVAVPLSITSIKIRDRANISKCMQETIDRYAEPFGWETEFVLVNDGSQFNSYTAKVVISGPPPFPDGDAFDNSTAICSVESMDLRFVPVKAVHLEVAAAVPGDEL